MLSTVEGNGPVANGDAHGGTALLTVDLSCTVPEALDALAHAIEECGFKTLGQIDLAARLQSNGFDSSACCVVEICNAGIAHGVLSAMPEMASLLPCRLAVQDQGGRTRISTVLPTSLASLLHAPQEVLSAAGMVDQSMRDILTSVAARLR